MAQTAADRKATETRRKQDAGLQRKSFWLDAKSMAAIEQYKAKHGGTYDQAINALLQQTQPG